MQRNDIKAGLAVTAVIAVFLLPSAREAFVASTKACPYLMSFVKFAVLATFGECIGLRIRAGVYTRPGFGVLPRALVWGLLGVGIKAAFTMFTMGAPAVLAEIGLPVDASTIRTGSFPWRLLCAFAISVGMNCIFAPVFMTAHKVTDSHIEATGGTLAGFFTPIPVASILQNINWSVMWHFVFARTIPFFWIPAHTLTFLLPSYLQVVFAALLGVALGVILAIAAAKGRNKPAAE